MNKILIVLVGLVFIALMVFFVISIFTNPSPPVQNQISTNVSSGSYGSNTNSSSYNTLDSGVSTSTSFGNSTNGNGSIAIYSSSGGEIQVQDFTKDPLTVEDPVNTGQYYLGYHFTEGVPDSTATDSPPYVIDYIASDQFFNVVLYKEPIAKTRQEAEQYLMQHLGITQDQMCGLKYLISVPFWVNQYYTGTSLGFSFCPGATQLPQ